MTITACQKPFFGGNMEVKMTDAPASYQSVFIDLQKVMVHYEGRPDDTWMELKSNPGIYDLLTLRNNVTVIIAKDEKIPLGTITQIRLVLGKNNSLVTGGTTFGLITPSASESGLKINVHDIIKRNDNLVVTLDFDADASIVLTGNGEYMLKPVIKVREITNN